jgi:glycosyltransferase involved in cell wall biosynthesis
MVSFQRCAVPRQGTLMSHVEVQPSVLVVGPLPPPEFGVAKATKLMVESPVLSARMRIIHLDTTDPRGLANIGRIDWRNVYLGCRHWASLVRVLATKRPDAVLLTVSQGRLALIRDGLFVLTSRAFRRHVVSYLRGSGYADMRVRQGWVAAGVLRAVFKASSRIIVLGDSLVSMVHAVYPGARVAVVPNGCPPAVQENQVAVRDERLPVLLYLGALSPGKGVNEALRVAQEVAASVPAFEFILCGEWSSASYQAETERLVEREGLSRIIRFPGPTRGADKALLLARAWVLVVPSRSEGQPWAILEAMSAGVPVVATDTGAIAETVGHGIGGFVVPVGDTASLAKNIVVLVEDEALWRRMSQESVRRYRERFTLERSHAALADELERVARGD